MLLGLVNCIPEINIYEVFLNCRGSATVLKSFKGISIMYLFYLDVYEAKWCIYNTINGAHSNLKFSSLFFRFSFAFRCSRSFIIAFLDGSTDSVAYISKLSNPSVTQNVSYLGFFIGIFARKVMFDID